MPFFSYLGGLSAYSRSDPLPAFNTIWWRANQILKGRSPEAVDEAAVHLQQALGEWKEEWAREAVEKYITQRVSELFSDGGWELEYLRREAHHYSDEYYSPVSAGEIRDLLENWPSWADEAPDFPSTDDIDDFDALGEMLCSGYSTDDISGLESATDADLYAVLALMRLEEAACHIGIFKGMHVPGGTPERRKLSSLSVAANSVIEAMEIICYAERNISDARSAARREEMRVDLEQKLRREGRTEAARQGGLAKNFGHRQAQAFAKQEWSAHREEYNHNKSAFARHYARRIKNEMGVDVTEKTIREVWLTDSPSAGTPAGQQAPG